MFMEIFPSAARLRRGTIKLKIPVETNSGSSFGSKSLGVRPRAAARAFLLIGSFCLRHGHTLRAAFLEANLDRQNARAGLLRNVDATLLRGDDAEFGEEEPRADYRMAGEFEFFARCEDSQASERVIFGRLLHEDSFGKIHFASDGEHGVVGEAIAVGDDRERVALKTSGGKNIERVEAAFHSRSIVTAEQDVAVKCARAGRRSFR